MIAVFRKNLFVNGLMLLPYIAVLRSKSILYPELYIPSEKDNEMVHFIYQFLPQNGLWQAILAIILIFIQSWMINILSNRNRITKVMSGLPGLCFAILISSIPSFLTLNPILLGITFLIISLFNLFQTYKTQHCASQIFNSGFFIVLASFFWFPFLYLLGAAYIGLMTMRSFKFKEKMQLLIGFLTPYFLLFTIYSLGDNAWARLIESIQSQLYIGWPSGVFAGQAAIVSGFFIFLLVLSLVSYNSFAIKKSIQVQKKIDILFWMMLFGIFSVFFATIFEVENYQILVVPFSFFLAMNLLKIKNPMTAELVHVIMLACIFLAHYKLDGL